MSLVCETVLNQEQNRETMEANFPRDRMVGLLVLKEVPPNGLIYKRLGKGLFLARALCISE